MLARFFDAIEPYIRASLLATCRDPTLVDDALQSAYLKYIKVFRSTRHSIPSEGYFLIIAKHCLIDELRRIKEQLPLDEIVQADVFLPEGVEDSYEVKMFLLQRAILQLKGRCRYIIESYYLGQKTSRELAVELGVSPASIHMTIKRCRDQLHDILALGNAQESNTGSGVKRWDGLR